MKALIFNSGLGSRLGELTAHNPKCLVKLGNGETIFHRQLRLLHACGIREFVVTTGPFADQVRAETCEFERAGCSFEFFANERYAETNYLYSFWHAREALAGNDVLMLHGDLVFDAAYVRAVLDAPAGSLGSVNEDLPLPPKDFKARVADGRVREVSVGIFDSDCVAFQPFYRLTAESLQVWLDAIDRFVAAGETGVYAENAANEVFGRMDVHAFSYAGHFVEEVDTSEDLARVSAEIRLFDFAQQPVYELRAEGPAPETSLTLAAGFDAQSVRNLRELLGRMGVRHPLVVAEGFFEALTLKQALDATGIPYERFQGFAPNPTNDEVLAGIAAYEQAGCDSLISVGGGSAIDVAKCIKQFQGLDDAGVRAAVAKGDLPYRATPHLAVPTTAGTGSESTHFAVMYLDGTKLSVAADGLQPNAVLLDAKLLAGLPLYQKKCTMLDALCQAIESYWSVRSAPESRAYACEAIALIRENYRSYLGLEAVADDALEADDAAWNILRAANVAGKAINLTTTTAAHAMSYKLTSLYGIPHGHAVALCLPHTWRALLGARDEDVPEGLRERLGGLARMLCGRDAARAEDGLRAFENIYAQLDMPAYELDAADLDTLVASVNVQRLSNFPKVLGEDELRAMYSKLIG